MSRALVWFRRDLRLADHPALQAVLDAGLDPMPVYVHAPQEEGDWPPGAASRAWLARSLEALDADLRARGSALVVRAGDSLATLRALVAETGASAVAWHRQYAPAERRRDAAVEAGLRADGLQLFTGNGSLLSEPDEVLTGGGTPYRVFTPYWRKASARLASLPVEHPAPRSLPALPVGLETGSVAALGLAPSRDWDRGFWSEWTPGEAGAQELLEAFLDGAARGYREQRNLPDRVGTSKLSPHLHFGEVSPVQVARRVLAARRSLPEDDRTAYLGELGWREFSHHLLFHQPHTPTRNLDPRFDAFAWNPPDPALLAAWQQGRTGVPLVDAGMRELWHTGWMHNRVRMVVASFLTRNLRMHWRHGAEWFWDTLVDADLANNTQGWQWSAGSGADAAPYFRIFNPAAQAARFDPHGRYIRRWVPELAQLPAPALFAPWEKPALARALAPGYPAVPIVDLRESRESALAAYQALRA